jgi:predicted TIM-barrel fold metal-dependent hydrolase
VLLVGTGNDPLVTGAGIVHKLPAIELYPTDIVIPDPDVDVWWLESVLARIHDESKPSFCGDGWHPTLPGIGSSAEQCTQCQCITADTLKTRSCKITRVSQGRCGVAHRGAPVRDNELTGLLHRGIETGATTMITDAQMHVWEVDRPGRPWPQPPRNAPQLPDGFSAEQALAAMDAAGVERTVIVPPTWIGENNATALEAAAKHPSRFAVMGRFDMTAADREQQLAGWLQQPGMLGIRLTFIANPTPDQLDDGSLEWFWATCERRGIPLMLFLPGMAQKAEPIAVRHPNLTIVLDHMARRLSPPGAEAFADLGELLALATHPHVFVKVSSVPNFSAEPYPHRDIQPYLRRIYDAFGPRRLFWGSDITRLKGSYADCLRLFQEGLDFLSAEDREWILGRALAEALNWPEGAG